MTELARVGLFGALPGQTLSKLADRMRRDEVAAGSVIVREGEPGDRFYVLLSGVAGVSQSELGQRSVMQAASSSARSRSRCASPAPRRSPR